MKMFSPKLARVMICKHADFSSFFFRFYAANEMFVMFVYLRNKFSNIFLFIAFHVRILYSTR